MILCILLAMVVMIRRDSRDSLFVKSAALVIERLRVRIPAGPAGEFSSPELTVRAIIRCPLTPVLPQWHVKDPGHSAQSAFFR